MLDQHFSGAIASNPMLCFLCLYLILIHFVPFRTLTRSPCLFPPGGLLFPLASPTFLPPLSPFFSPKRAYFLLLRKAELARSQTSPVDEGKYIILTKERQTDVFTRVCLEDVAQRCRQEAQVGGSDRRGQKCGVKSDFLFV